MAMRSIGARSRIVRRLAYMYRTYKNSNKIEQIARKNKIWCEVKSEVQNQKLLIEKRKINKITIPVDSFAKKLAEARIKKEINKVLPKVSGAGKRRSEVKIQLGLGAPQYEYTTTYGDRGTVANSYGYPVFDHNHKLCISPAHRVVIIGGIITIYDRHDNPRTGCKAYWLKRSRGYNHSIIEGYLVRDHHVCAKSLERAVKIVNKKRHATAINLWKQRALNRENSKVLSRIWVGYDDSINAGNCKIGTDSFCKKLFQKIGAEIGAIRADALIEYAKTIGELVFVKRAISAAFTRYGY